MSSDELFPLDSVCMDSPRLAWMKRHGVTVKAHEVGELTESPETGATIYPWYAERAGLERVWGGYTSDHAMQELAESLKLPLWSVKGWE